MDPNSGRLYESLQAAQDDGVLDAVELKGTLEQARRISEAVAEKHRAEQGDAAPPPHAPTAHEEAEQRGRDVLAYARVLTKSGNPGCRAAGEDILEILGRNK